MCTDYPRFRLMSHKVLQSFDSPATIFFLLLGVGVFDLNSSFALLTTNIHFRRLPIGKSSRTLSLTKRVPCRNFEDFHIFCKTFCRLFSIYGREHSGFFLLTTSLSSIGFDFLFSFQIDASLLAGWARRIEVYEQVISFIQLYLFDEQRSIYFRSFIFFPVAKTSKWIKFVVPRNCLFVSLKFVNFISLIFWFFKIISQFA